MADRLEEILSSTLTAIQTGKEEIFFIAETTRREVDRLSHELTQLRTEIKETIEAVDEQQLVEKRLRQRLMEVSRDFRKFSEKEMLETYTQATDAQMKLQLLQSREVQLRARRDEIERALRQLNTTVERAEQLMTQVNVAINLLEGGIEDISRLKGLEQRQEIGLRVIKAQEEERRRVAREIHDGPAQTLANIVLRLEIAEKLLDIDPNRVKAELTDLKKVVRDNLKDIRRIIFDLRPMALDDLGLIPTLTKYLNNYWETYKIQPELKVDGRERRLPAVMEVAIFRLIQEAMTNAAKHAKTPRVVISLQFQEDSVSASITDYGLGFDANSEFNRPGEHFGLIGMRERVEMFSGRFSLRSFPGEGTILDFSFPIQQEGGTSG